MEKKLYKSNTNRLVCGVCAGVGEYFGIDPTLIRVVWAISALVGSVGFWAYIIAAVIIPSRP